MRYLIIALSLLALLCAPGVCEGDGEAEDDKVYTLMDESGARITSRLGRMYMGDEYISGDDMLYVIQSVDDAACTAVAKCVGEEPQEAKSAFAALAEGDGKKLICMYSTHSDESYVPNDGDSSLLENAGIYDVGGAFKDNLEELGVEVRYSHETFLPHDAGAYRRSRSVAGELLKENPDALIDIHRDGVSADEYKTTVNGDETSMVRLFVGKSNANAGENRAFAKQLKAVGDEQYPGLIKDIYIGKGNYNQDLYPQSILLEFGTHEIDKDLVIDSTEYMADVVYQTLYGEGGGAASKRESDGKGVSAGVGWLIGLAIAAAIVFALAATGTFRGAGEKLSRGWREMTASGKKPKE